MLQNQENNFNTKGAVRAKAFFATLGQVMGRPSWLHVPGVVLKVLLGEMAQEMLLSGQGVAPKRLAESSYDFNRDFPDQKAGQTLPTIQATSRLVFLVRRVIFLLYTNIKNAGYFRIVGYFTLVRAVLFRVIWIMVAGQGYILIYDNLMLVRLKEREYREYIGFDVVGILKKTSCALVPLFIAV